MAKFAQLKNIVENAEHDAEKFFQNNNAAAGIRLRKSLQHIKKLAQQIRQEVTDIKGKRKSGKLIEVPNATATATGKVLNSTS